MPCNTTSVRGHTAAIIHQICLPYLGIGGAGVVALYKLGFSNQQAVALQKGSDIMERGIGHRTYKSDVIFEEIRERAAQVHQKK